jgi:Zn-dependent M28 family amino/carboxypeptidase
LRTQEYITGVLKDFGIRTEKQSFESETPLGTLNMTNIRAFFDPEKDSDKRIVIGTHYDTKYIEGLLNFSGANDGTSGVGIFLELAGILRRIERRNRLEMVFFDGEESFEEKDESDWFYGSRHYVEQLKKENAISSVRFMVLIDMVGDRDFKANLDLNSSPVLVEKIRKIASSLGYGDHFFGRPLKVRDDHIPFIESGIPSVNIIDFEYGGSYSPGMYWHTAEDTLDKVSSKTLKIVGDVLIKLIKELDGEI